MQCGVCLVDLVTACDTISPDAAELVEMIETPTGDEDQVFDRRKRRLQKSGDLLGVIAHGCRAKDYEWALLPRVETAVKKSRSQCEP